MRPEDKKVKLDNKLDLEDREMELDSQGHHAIDLIPAAGQSIEEV